MQLVRLQGGPSQWNDIKDAADILWRSTLTPDIHAVTTALRDHYQNPSLGVSELDTGFNAGRRGVVVCNAHKITLAFLGSHPSELHMNMWTDAKGPAWWEMPYPVFEGGNRIHSFYRAMWHAMRRAALDALASAVRDMGARGATPRQISCHGVFDGGVG